MTVTMNIFFDFNKYLSTWNFFISSKASFLDESHKIYLELK